MQKQVDTSGILNLVYPDKQAVLIAAKDSYTTPRSFIEGEKGTIYFDGSTGVIKSFMVEHRHGDNSKFNFNQFDHRMASEFTDFVKIIDTHDTQKANDLYEHSIAVMDVLAKAKQSVSTN